MTDADESLRRLFVPAARAHDPSLEIEAREVTPAGWIVSRGARRVSVIERQERHGHITHRQGAAGRELYRCYSVGILGARDRDAASGARGPGGYADLQLDAATRFRRAHDRLGPQLWEVAHAVACDDVPIKDFARLRGLNQTAVQALLRVGLDMLGDMWGIHE